MIRRLLKINLNGTNNKKHILILVIVSIMLTHLKSGISNITYPQSFGMGNILILVFGGINTNFNIIDDFPSFTLWILPNVLLIYLVNIDIIHKLRETASLILPRTKKRLHWIISFNITLYVIVIKYYLILYISSLSAILMRVGTSAFINIDIIPNNYNQLFFDTNQYLILLYLIILNILAMICLISFINNVYYIFSNSNHAAVICMMICFITVCVTQFSKINKFLLMNQAMLTRHNLFKNGFEGFNISFSILYLLSFLTINFILNIIIVKKKDISDI